MPHICFSYRAAFGIVVLMLAGCVSVPDPRPGGSEERATQILKQAADAQGPEALERLHDVNARFEGKWSFLAARLQPVLVDDRFRGTSEERYLVHETTVSQAHSGPGGVKQVFRDKAGIRVLYNGKESSDADVRDAAALVADDYRMFLLGPRFFQERQATLQYLGTETVDGASCDNLLAALTPGIGNSAEDRVVLSIDQSRHGLRRVRITLNGLESTRGAVADIFLRDPIRIGGVVWPTAFYEELKRPFDTSVHHWRLTAIDFDRHLEAGSPNAK